MSDINVTVVVEDSPVGIDVTTGGAQGPAGPPGPEGPEGPQGPAGEIGGHPDLATHDALGLATDAALTAGLAGKSDTGHNHAGVYDPAGSTAAHIGMTPDAHDASAISVVPAGGIAAGNVQAALEELDSEKAASHAHPYEASGAVATHAAAGDPHTGYRLEADSPVDPVAGTAGLRTLGTGGQQAAVGSHAHGGVYDPAGTAASAVSTHEADTTSVHGIADTAQLRTAAQITSEIAAAIAALVASAPGALDTLDELAAALGDDANFAATVTNALAGKQPLDADLTAIAALTTTAFGRSLLEVANSAAGRTLLGLVIGTNVQAWSAVLDATTASFLTADETKLDGIEALADVTDAANVDAAGAVMNGDTSTAAMGFVIDEDSFASNLDTKVPTQQSAKAYIAAQIAAISATYPTVEDEGTPVTVRSTINFVGAPVTVTDAGGKTVVTITHQSAADLLTAIKTVDGAGSGLDADLLDGSSSADFATSGHTHDTFTEGEHDARDHSAAMSGVVLADLSDGDNVKGFADARADINLARPTGYASIEWLAEDEPTNWQDGDSLIVVEP